MERARLVFTLALLGGVVASCTGSSGGSGGGGATAGFQLERISVRNNEVWEINREIEFEFTQEVDFSTVSSNTLNIETQSGLPATGSFSFKQSDTDGDGVLDTTDRKTIVWQPNCPLLSDRSDAGLRSDGSTYVIKVVGRSSGTQNTLRSAGGSPLQVTQTRRFKTPDSTEINTIFLDTAFGPPTPVVRTKGSLVTDSISYVQVGGNADPTARIFFEFDPVTQTFDIEPGPNAPATVPLNLYSDPASEVALFLEFNQPVSSDTVNISDRRLILEFKDAAGVWHPIDTDVTLISNCSGAGATVRLRPVGVLPASSEVRAVVLPGFQDIVGQTSLTAINGFSVAPTRPLAFGSLMNPTDGADEFIEDFDFDDFEDDEVLFDTPAALWKDGSLESAFDFTGTGGPGTNFDWYVKAGETFVFDTSSTVITGGPNGLRDTSVVATGGVVDVRDLVIEQGGTLRVQGNNTMLVNATGTVQIDGILNVSGFNAKDVDSVNTGDQPVTGGAGVAGSGSGGSASENIKTSTALGGRGKGPFGEKNTGGYGGESGFADVKLGKDARRPGGGGGGRFAPDFEVGNLAGLGATAGLSGHAMSRSAITGTSPAQGGLAGDPIFVDGITGNDVFGVIPTVSYNAGTGVGTLLGLTHGELTRVWAGYGGGGGGDALPSIQFPTPDWGPDSDEKGGGGGAGGGGLRIRALGPIVFGHAGGVIGRILAEGGLGATGENTLLQDHVGGTGGSGTGGHVLLESATRVDFIDGDASFANPMTEFVSVRGGAQRVGPTFDLGGDPIPANVSYGGSGGPGIIQIHVPRLNAPGTSSASTDIVIPSYANGLAGNGGNLPTGVSAELDKVTKPYARIMIPTFGPRSKARSKWISLGGADVDSGGGTDLVRFLFGGTDPTPGADQGKILTTLERVDEATPILGPEALPSGTVAILANGVTLVITGASLDPLTMSAAPISEDLYLRTPSLLKHFTLRLTDTSMPAVTHDFEMTSASYDDGTVTLTLVTDGGGQTLAEFVAAAATPEYELIPRFFRVCTAGLLDVLPDSAYVKVTFEGAADDGFGNPDESVLLVPETGDISDFNALLPGELKYFRFLTEFNLAAGGGVVTPDTKTIELKFLKIPFVF